MYYERSDFYQTETQSLNNDFQHKPISCILDYLLVSLWIVDSQNPLALSTFDLVKVFMPVEI